MLRKSLQIQALPATILPWDRRKCRWIANSVIIQCVVVYVGAFTILQCFWSPEKSTLDYDKLARIMYLYDYNACGYKLKTSSSLSNIRLSNETYGLPVLPIKWATATVTVSTKLSSKTRVYVESSLALHVPWMIIAIILNFIIRSSKNPRLLKFSLFLFFYSSIIVIIFDMSMAFVYIAHIQQSVTKGMVLRYSGWSVELKLESYDDFAGWLPIAASALWMRGVVILAWNIYCCKFINSIRRKIKKREVKRRLITDGYRPIPDPFLDQANDKTVLYYRRGEYKPTVKEDPFNRVFFK